MREIESQAESESASWKAKDAATNKLLEEKFQQEIREKISDRLDDVEESLARKEYQMKKIEKLIDASKSHSRELYEHQDRIENLEA